MHMHSQTPENDDCFAVRQAARHISQLYDRRLSQVGMTTTQFSILSALGSGSSLTMNELAQAMMMDRTTLVRALRPLLQNGFVASKPDQWVNRRLQLALTGSGRVKLDEAMVHWRAAQDEFERKFGPEQAAFLRRELFRVTRDVSNT
ncbi:MarR family transcriptional regulator [Caballeronia mineralivorans PML1(12)]|uniref:MarR family transcriptional regulator n=2 Tax=Caballeronia mineralivorans TaxID=2010198 RepID=A0A0J1D158_9BURK|nr:MarR family transcriptional regulator [Caballeronia mineralivorans PML1(12)]